MPHIVLEYSANLEPLADFSPLFREIHNALHEIGGIKLENCKSRAYAAAQFYIADGDEGHAFIHLNIEFVKGRSVETRQAIGQKCLDLLKQHYQNQLDERLQITVNLDDIALDFYFKHPQGSLNYP